MTDDRPPQPPEETSTSPAPPAAEADAAAVARMEDEGGPPSPDEPAAADPTRLGRCLSCSETVDLAQTFQVSVGKPNGAPAPPPRRMHRRGQTKKNEIGEVCGPVAEALIFHVVYQVAGQVMQRAQMAAPQPPEENYEVLAMWERELSEKWAQRYRPVDKETGQPIVGVAAPHVPIVVTTWKYLGAM